MTEPTTDPKTTTLAGKTRQLVALTPGEIAKRTGMPMQTAEMKHEGTKLGWLVTGVGLVLLLGSLLTGVLIVLNKVEVGLMVVLLVAIPGAGGLFMSLVGANMVSRDASPIMDKLGSIAEKLIRAKRGTST